MAYMVSSVALLVPQTTPWLRHQAVRPRIARRGVRLQIGDGDERDDVGNATAAFDREFAAFAEPGGEYELDMEAMGELVASYRAAELRWEMDPTQPRRLGVLDDTGSQMHAWWNDPVDGPITQAKVFANVKMFKRRIGPPLQLLLIGAAFGSSFVAPVRIAWLSARCGLALHVLWPVARLALAGLARLTSGAHLGAGDGALGDGDLSDGDLGGAPRCDATHVLSVQHVLGASTVLGLASLEWHGSGLVVPSLLVGALGRLCLWPGLWYWRDLNAELLATAADSRAHALARCWRLATSALLLAEAALLGRLACALDAAGHFGAAPAALLALPPPLGPAAATLLRGPAAMIGAVLSMSAASPVPWVSAIGLGASRLLGAATSAAAEGVGLATGLPTRQGLRLLARLAQAAVGCYAAYWFAFSIEGGTRTSWGPSLQPRRNAITTLSATLLERSRLVRPPPSLAELRRADAASKGLVPRRRDDAATPMGFASAAEAEDLRLQMWQCARPPYPPPAAQWTAARKPLTASPPPRATGWQVQPGGPC